MSSQLLSPTMTESIVSVPNLEYQPNIDKNESFADLDEIQIQKDKNYKFLFLEFQRVLHERVCLILKRSVTQDDGTKKTDILNVLFNNLTCRLDTSLTDNLELKSPKRYYEVLAEYYVLHPEKVSVLENIEIELLWDDTQFQIIGGLILYLWVFSSCLKRKYFNNLIKTANKLFVLDVEHFTKRFQPVYDYLYRNILSSPTLWHSAEIQRIILEIFALVAKFYFYYNKDISSASLADFFSQTQSALTTYRDKLELPKGHTKIQTLNMFVNEVVRQLKVSKNEETTVLYLQHLMIFRGELEIPGTKTKINLQTVLLDYTTPGLPYYPTRKIRDQAKQTIDTIFPGGKITRLATNWAFRFLSPIELLKSWWFWILSWLTGLIFFLSFKQKVQKNPSITTVDLDEIDMMNRYSSYQEKEKEKLT